MGFRVLLKAGLLAIVTLAISSCFLSGWLNDVAPWSDAEQVTIIAIDHHDGASLGDHSEVAGSVVRAVSPAQHSGDNLYLSMRGEQLFEEVGESRSYDIVLFQDIDGDGSIDSNEPFTADTNEGAGFVLDGESSLIGSFELDTVTEELTYTLHTISATYVVTGDAMALFTLTVTADIPDATDVIFWYDQGGWYPSGGVTMTKSGSTFTATISNLDAGPLAFKYQIDSEAVWYPDHNEPGYFPNFWTFWDDAQIDWNSAIMLTEANSTPDYVVNLQLADLQGDAISDATNFTVNYGPVDPFWDFGLNPLSTDIHTTLPPTPGDALSGAGTLDLSVEAGEYYLVTISENSGTPEFMDHRVYFYARTGFDGATITAHLSRPADVSSIYTAHSLAEPGYDTTDVARGFALVNYTGLAASAPWNDLRDFAFMGLEVAFLPTGSFGPDVDTPFVYQIMMANETGSLTVDDLGLIAGSVLDYTGNTTLPFPDYKEYYGYSGWGGETSWDATSTPTDADLGIILGPVAGSFFIDYFGVGHLVRIPAIKTSGSYVHDALATVEVMMP